MKKQLSIFGPLYKYKYLIEYNKIDVKTNTTDVYWYKDEDEDFASCHYDDRHGCAPCEEEEENDD